MAFLDMLDGVGRVIGGTCVDPVNNPHFFSGRQVGDGTGVAGLNGCWSVAPATLSDPPWGIVIPSDGEMGGADRMEILTEGNLFEIHNVRLVIAVGLVDTLTAWSQALPFYEGVRNAFEAHMTLYGAVDIDAFPTKYKMGEITWSGNTYVGWDFTIRLRNMSTPIYTP